ncbi:MAG: TolC family protein [Pseudomonadota bacterium]
MRYQAFKKLNQCSARILTLALLSVSMFLACTHAYAHHTSLNIAVIETNSEQDQIVNQNKLFKDEIDDLFEGNRDVNFVTYAIDADAPPDQAETLLKQAYADPKNDIVVVLDVAANQHLGRTPSFSKPTFLPYVFNGRLTGLPLNDQSSGKKNLNYLTFNFDFEQELNSLKNVASFKNAVLIPDPRIAQSINPDMIADIKVQAKRAGVMLTIKPFSGDPQAFVAALPAETDAVLYGFLSNATKAQAQVLINAVNERNLVSFSLSGEDYVRMGALATNSPTTDTEKLARRTALNIEEVLRGESASDLPVFFETSNRLMINMATSRQIRVAPSFDVLSEALLINELPENAGKEYSLTQVAREAVKQNLSLAAQRLQAESAGQSVREVRGALLPQIGSSVEYSTRKETDTTRSGQLAESSTDGSLTLTQSLFSEELWAAFAIQKYSALSERELVKEIELDITQAAVNSYLNVLREKTSLEQERYNLDITRENFRLAQNRVDVGTQNASDLYRWESELANAKQAVLNAKSSYEQQRQQLNQILNRPINEEFTTTVETLDNPDLLISDKRIPDLIKNIYDLEALTDFFVDIGLEHAPELKKTEANISASKRQLESDRRAYWLPDLNLTSEYTNNFDEDRAAGGIEADDDWRVGIELSLPLYEGGARYARQAQSRLSVRQLETNLKDTKNQIEQDVRNTMEAAHASYNSIPLAKTSEQAAEKNYELVKDSYAQGARNITDVLDAQDALIDAREASLNSVYAFLIDLMNLQRAIGAYDFFLTDAQRIEFSDDLISRVTNNKTRDETTNDE